MSPIDYGSLILDALSDYTDILIKQRDLDLELAQKEQFIRATVNMLPDKDRKVWETLLDALGADVGLSAAIKRVLQDAPKKFHTASQVRKALEDNGFDFTRYTTNPLSSIHAALKRLKDDEAKMEKIDGVMAWRWIAKIPQKPVAVEKLEAVHGLNRGRFRSRFVPRFSGSMPRKSLGELMVEIAEKEKKSE